MVGYVADQGHATTDRRQVRRHDEKDHDFGRRQAKLEAVGFVVPPPGSQAYTQFVKSEIDLWTKVIKTAGIKPE